LEGILTTSTLSRSQPGARHSFLLVLRLVGLFVDTGESSGSLGQSILYNQRTADQPTRCIIFV